MQATQWIMIGLFVSFWVWYWDKIPHSPRHPIRHWNNCHSSASKLSTFMSGIQRWEERWWRSPVRNVRLATARCENATFPAFRLISPTPYLKNENDNWPQSNMWCTVILIIICINSNLLYLTDKHYLIFCCLSQHPSLFSFLLWCPEESCVILSLTRHVRAPRRLFPYKGLLTHDPLDYGCWNTYALNKQNIIHLWKLISLYHVQWYQDGY